MMEPIKLRTSQQLAESLDAAGDRAKSKLEGGAPVSYTVLWDVAADLRLIHTHLAEINAALAKAATWDEVLKSAREVVAAHFEWANDGVQHSRLQFAVDDLSSALAALARAEEGGKCKRCRGLKKIMRKNDTQGEWLDTCPDCHGTGKEKPCKRCKGKGRLDGTEGQIHPLLYETGFCIDCNGTGKEKPHDDYSDLSHHPPLAMDAARTALEAEDEVHTDVGD